MRSVIHHLTLALACGVLVSCASSKSATVRDKRAWGEYTDLLQDARDHIMQLGQQSQLPGAGLVEHGHCQVCGDFPLDDHGHAVQDHMSYPITFSAWLTPRGRTTAFQYKMTKNSREATWHIDAAWKMEPGQDWTEVR
jgi:hypothetical protein